MFNSPILDLIILLSFTYFIGSLILTAINEIISAWLKIRAKDLKNTIENLFHDINWKQFIQTKFYVSPHIESLMLAKDKLPSYIPASNFILTLIEKIGVQLYRPNSIVIGIDASTLPQCIKDVLKDLWVKSQSKKILGSNEMLAFESEIEEYYNSAMDRATGWYKRKIRRISLLIGFVVAVILNIDTIKITNTALSDKKQLANAVEKIIQVLPSINKDDNINISMDNDSIEIIQHIRIDTLMKNTIDSVTQLKILYNNSTGYEMGYKGKFDEEWGLSEWGLSNKICDKEKIILFFYKLFGIIITCFALQLGSNYWFDMLNKAINIRATGKNPTEKNEKKSD